MSLLNSHVLYEPNMKKKSSNQENLTSSDIQPEASYYPPEGFSSSQVLKFTEDSERPTKTHSKLINITQNVPGSSKTRKIMLPIFYRNNSSNSPKKLYLESSFSVTPSKDSFCDSSISQIAKNSKRNLKKEFSKPTKATSTTFASMHTLSNLDGDLNHEIFNEKVNYEYEKELKASIHEGNFVAFCGKCKKETVCVMKSEIKSFVDLLLCCCSSLNVRGKVFVCPICSEIVLKTN